KRESSIVPLYKKSSSTQSSRMYLAYTPLMLQFGSPTEAMLRLLPLSKTRVFSTCKRLESVTYMPLTSCIVLHTVEGGSCPRTSPPEKQMLEPPPRRTGAQAEVKNWAVDASIPVLSARLVFSYAAVLTPLSVRRGPAPWR